MKEERIKVGLLFGGPSQEHEVSLMSANAIWTALDNNKYDKISIGITRDGVWYLADHPEKWMTRGFPENPSEIAERVRIDPGSEGGFVAGPQGEPVNLDVVFPVLHGPFGEDGTVQGLLELCGTAYVGSGVASSAVAMDKQIMKEIFLHHSLPVVGYEVFYREDLSRKIDQIINAVSEELGFPCFVKPANLGSSVGISKVNNAEQLPAALRSAAVHGRKIIVEEGLLNVRELECSVLGNREVYVAGPGEIIPAGEFYDYRSKYHDHDTELKMNVALPGKIVDRMRRLAVRAFQAVKGCGMARIDFFYIEEEQEIIVNEINTIPGFTAVSMYPRLWTSQGMQFSELVDRLIRLAIKRYELEHSWRNLLVNNE